MKTVICEMLGACGEITEALRSALVTVEGSANTFGDAPRGTRRVFKRTVRGRGRGAAAGREPTHPRIRGAAADASRLIRGWDRGAAA